MLTVLVVFLFLNSWRSTVITGLALPVSVLASFVPLRDLRLHAEHDVAARPVARDRHPDRRRDRGAREHRAPRRDGRRTTCVAAHEGTDEIGLAVTATTFSIVAVFVPVGFMPGIAGQWFKPFALTIAAAVLVSLFVSFSLDPMLSAYWPDPQLEAHERRNALARALERFNLWFDRQADRYKTRHRAGRSTTGGRWSAIAGVSFVGAIALQVAIGGFGFVPVSDNSELNIAIETPPGSSLDYTTSRPEEIATLDSRDIRKCSTRTRPSAAPPGSGEVDNASIYVRLTPKNTAVAQPGSSSGRCCATRCDASAARRRTRSRRASAAARKQLQLQLQGPDQRRSNRYAEQIEQIMARDARRGGRRSLDARPEAGVQRSRQPRPRRHARRESEPARRVAALRLCRRRRGHVGRSVGHLALRPCAACRARRARTRPISGNLPVMVTPPAAALPPSGTSVPAGGAVVRAAQPGRDDHAELRSGADRPLPAGARRHHRRERLRRIAGQGVAGGDGRRRTRSSCRRATTSRRAARRRARTRCSAASSRRSAWRSC